MGANNSAYEGVYIPRRNTMYTILNVCAENNSLDILGDGKNRAGYQLTVYNHANVAWHKYIGDSFRGENTFTWRAAVPPPAGSREICFDQDEFNSNVVLYTEVHANFDKPTQRWMVRHLPEVDAFMIINAGTGKALTHQGYCKPVRCCIADEDNLYQQWKITETQ